MERSRMRVISTLALVTGLSLLLGCTREVAAGLDETEANRAVVSLARAGVDSEKAADPGAEGRFKILVGRDDATIAISVLSGEEIPRARPAAAKEPSLVASPDAERAARVADTSAKIERSLASVDGVLDARVHLDVPTVDPLLSALASGSSAPSAARATASVLLRHRGTTPPLAIEDVRRLVSGAVSGLAPADVAVVLVPVPAPSLASERALAQVGPISVARGSLSTARAILASILLVVALLAGLVLWLGRSLRRLREAREEEPSKPRS